MSPQGTSLQSVTEVRGEDCDRRGACHGTREKVRQVRGEEDIA